MGSPHFSSFPSGENRVAGNLWPLSHNQPIELSNEPSPMESPTRVTERVATPTRETTPDTVPRLSTSDSSLTSAPTQYSDLLVESLKKTVEETPDHGTQGNAQSEHLEPRVSNKGEDLPLDVRDPQSRVQEDEVHATGLEIEYTPSEYCDESDGSSPSGPDSSEPLQDNKDISCETHDSAQPGSEQIMKSALHEIDLNDPAKVVEFLETLQSNGILQKHGWKREESVRPNKKGSGETETNSEQGKRFPCTQCSKKFTRRCELKYVLLSLFGFSRLIILQET